MAQNKTTENNNDVTALIASIKNEERRKDFSAIVKLITTQSGLKPKMWGTAIVGFGSYHYIYESGRKGDAPLAALASRSNAITLYLSANFEKREELLSRFGKYKTGKACIYIQKLEDINLEILAEMVRLSIEHVRATHPD